MRVGEVVIDTNHAVVFISGALVGSDYVPGSVPIVCPVRSGKQIEEPLYARINSDGDARVRSGVAAAPRVAGRRQQTLMGSRIGHSGNCRGCLYFSEPIIICIKKGAIMY